MYKPSEDEFVNFQRFEEDNYIQANQISIQSLETVMRDGSHYASLVEKDTGPMIELCRNGHQR